ncbi:MAG: complex I NDUFA9 subunit family protein [Pseudomonadota bacterium]
MKITVFGGSGFVGQALLQQLDAAGHEVRVASRRQAPPAFPYPWTQADPYDADQRAQAVRGQNAVINLIGILHGSQAEFLRAHADLPAQMAQSCLQEGVPLLLHMSALHAAPDAPSMYLRSKGLGAQQVHALANDKLRVVSFHPSVIFGAKDNFLNQFATLLRYSPGVMLLPGARARFAPVYVDDVAAAFVRALQDETTPPRIQLCGPRDYSLQELVELTAQWSGHKRLILPMPAMMARLTARLMSLLPNPPLTTDNLDSMRVDSMCASGEPRQPSALEVIAPGYLRKA